MHEKWLSIQEFAQYKDKSISTVRRYIKSNKVTFKDDGGKYYILVKNYQAPQEANESEAQKIEELLEQNKKLKHELDEAKMLIQLYEQGQFLSQTNTLPEMPQSL
ncbi:MAG: hypothetical protein CME62_17085 [Halobacteriovoraceae bacterium]|nr:hypothetical protein [Halobacteriovoraceae bacterium]|tara:strand:+ start:8290 stop:8604 length:315 start_codon:yes stop_codon:yes gene_type:complete